VEQRTFHNFAAKFLDSILTVHHRNGRMFGVPCNIMQLSCCNWETFPWQQQDVHYQRTTKPNTTATRRQWGSPGDGNV